ncbi:hypothetical protein ACTXT7_004135 [Hymenolepis weldensis]
MGLIQAQLDTAADSSILEDIALATNTIRQHHNTKRSKPLYQHKTHRTTEKFLIDDGFRTKTTRLLWLIAGNLRLNNKKLHPPFSNFPSRVSESVIRVQSADPAIKFNRTYVPHKCCLPQMNSVFIPALADQNLTGSKSLNKT